MIEIAKNIYCFPIPLPKSPLKELNGYIVKGENRHLMIDVGFNMPEVLKAIADAIKELGISLSDIDIFLTHLHADHTGAIEELKKECGKIYISKADSEIVNMNFKDSAWIEHMSIQGHMGFPDNETLDYKEHPAYVGGTLSHTNFEIVTAGTKLSYGGYDFEVIDLKGHTPEQLGLFDKVSGVFFCGDHILSKITPNINLWDFKEDYLGLFLENLKKVKETLDVKTLLSAHRAHIADTNARIDELLAHHENRLNSTLSILESGKQTVYEVASEISWDYGGGEFINFPVPQKWFAASEVFAHLEHLRKLGKIDLTIDGLTYRYSIR